MTKAANPGVRDCLTPEIEYRSPYPQPAVIAMRYEEPLQPIDANHQPNS